MSLSDVGSICSIIGLVISILSLIISGFIAVKFFSIKIEQSDKNHHNQKVNGVGNSASYTNGK